MKKFLCVLLAAVFALSSVGCVFAAEDYHDEGKGGTSWSDAYIIDSIEDLENLRDKVNDGTEAGDRYYKLDFPNKDVGLTQKTDWTPIGNAWYDQESGTFTHGKAFTGHFDGNGHTVHVNITRTSSFYDVTSEYDSRRTDVHRGGLFGWIDSSGTAIKDLTIDSTNIEAYYSGGIAYGLKNGTIESCNFGGKVYFSDRYTSRSVIGGIVGWLVNGTIKNCKVTNGSITSKHYAGGIAAWMTGGNIENCEVASGVTILSNPLDYDDDDLSYAGGIVGIANIQTTEFIKDCSFNGSVRAWKRNSRNEVYSDNLDVVYAGGIVGHLTGGTVQENEVLEKAEIFSDYSAGGIAGRAASGSKILSNDMTLASQVQANGQALGGIIGLMGNGTVSDNTSYATLSGNAVNKGGIVGMMEGGAVNGNGNKYTGTGATYGIGYDSGGNAGDKYETSTASFVCTKIRTPISITTTSPLPSVNAGGLYSQALATDALTDATVTWSLIGGKLPDGLTFNTSTGTISGTATTAGTFNFTVQADALYTDGQSSRANRDFSITVNLVISDDAILSSGTVNDTYNHSFSVKGGGTKTITWTRTDGTLPSGLTLSSNGTLTGIPTAFLTALSIYTFYSVHLKKG